MRPDRRFLLLLKAENVPKCLFMRMLWNSIKNDITFCSCLSAILGKLRVSVLVQSAHTGVELLFVLHTSAEWVLPNTVTRRFQLYWKLGRAHDINKMVCVCSCRGYTILVCCKDHDDKIVIPLTCVLRPQCLSNWKMEWTLSIQFSLFFFVHAFSASDRFARWSAKREGNWGNTEIASQ